jgi:DNA polymerase-3 subunit gamma/tau
MPDVQTPPITPVAAPTTSSNPASSPPASSKPPSVVSAEVSPPSVMDEKVKRFADFFNGQILDVELDND